jgi:hypothetical protein
MGFFDRLRRDSGQERDQQTGEIKETGVSEVSGVDGVSESGEDSQATPVAAALGESSVSAASSAAAAPAAPAAAMAPNSADAVDSTDGADGTDAENFADINDDVDAFERFPVAHPQLYRKDGETIGEVTLTIDVYIVIPKTPWTRGEAESSARWEFTVADVDNGVSFMHVNYAAVISMLRSENWIMAESDENLWVYIPLDQAERACKLIVRNGGSRVERTSIPTYQPAE